MSWLSSARSAMRAVGASEAEIEAYVTAERFDDEAEEMDWSSEALEMVRELYAHSAEVAWAGIETALYVKRLFDRGLPQTIVRKIAEVRVLLAGVQRSDEDIARQCGIPHGGRYAQFVAAVREGVYGE